MSVLRVGFIQRRLAIILAIAFAFSCWKGAQPALGREMRCRAVQPVTVAWTETRDARLSPQDARNAAIAGALREAVRKGVGLEVRSFTSVDSATENDRFTEKVNEIAVQRVQGFILSYDVLDVQRHAISVQEQEISLKINAKICVPFATDLPEIVAFGPFTWESGRADPQVQAEAVSTLSGLPHILLSSEGPNGGYHDILVTGTIFGPEIFREDRSAEIRVIGDYLGQGSVTDLPAVVDKMKVTLVVEAVIVADQTRLAETAIVSELWTPATSSDALAQKLVNKAVRTVMPAMAKKIATQASQ